MEPCAGVRELLTESQLERTVTPPNKVPSPPRANATPLHRADFLIDSAAKVRDAKLDGPSNAGTHREAVLQSRKLSIRSSLFLLAGQRAHMHFALGAAGVGAAMWKKNREGGSGEGYGDDFGGFGGGGYGDDFGGGGFGGGGACILF